jgi:hypothetical protein
MSFVACVARRSMSSCARVSVSVATKSRIAVVAPAAARQLCTQRSSSSALIASRPPPPKWCDFFFELFFDVYNKGANSVSIDSIVNVALPTGFAILDVAAIATDDDGG